ncbi:MAG: D-glycerate dehydrogenase [Candidatus Hydrogenedentes bacterium]|jgi:glyoxylate reductase|nr:D-glycerate dehydrogenase [Candidatus Hydrogenedentota bacterium]
MKIVITRRIPQAGMDILIEAVGKDSLVHHDSDLPLTREALLAMLPGAKAVLSTLSEKMDGEAMDAAGGGLQVIANMAVGYDNIDCKAAAARNIVATNTPGVLTEATADLAWALILGAARRTGESERFLRAGNWKGWAPLQYLGASIHGKTLGIYGMGRIGCAVARRACGFEMPVLYCDAQHADLETEKALNARWVDKDTLVRESDILTLHCPLTDETRHAFTLAEFKKMKKEAVIVNTSRGPVIKEEDLHQALRDGLIFAAGLDVYELEPTIYKPILELENVLMLPHLGSATVETRATMARMAAENIVAVLNGRQAPNPIQ